MQRRAVAIYLVFFAILGAAAYGLILTTSGPSVSVDGPTYENGADVSDSTGMPVVVAHPQS